METGIRTDTVKAAMASRSLVVVAIVVEIIGGADHPVVPPGLPVPLAVGLALCVRPRFAFVVVGSASGPWPAFDAPAAPETGDRPESGDAVLVSGVLLQIVAITAVVVTGAPVLVARLRAVASR